MSSEGLKMVEKRYGWPEMTGKHKNQENQATQGGAAATFVGPIRVRPAAVGLEILRPRSSGGGAPPCPAHVQ